MEHKCNEFLVKAKSDPLLTVLMNDLDPVNTCGVSP